MFAAIDNRAQGADQFVAVGNHGESSVPAGGPRPKQHVGDSLRCYLGMIHCIGQQRGGFPVQQVGGFRRD
jgi:hypothetical protein